MRRFALLLALLCAAPLSARGLSVASPSDGATLRGGSLATLTWTADALPRGAEEWEAFLSVDGGAYYAFRITPHLDVTVRTFAFVVPNVDARDARILIRTGDEHRETALELPACFRISADRTIALPIPTATTNERAEAARPGDRDVVAWADGDRDGERVTHESAAPRHTQLARVEVANDDAQPFAETTPLRATPAPTFITYLRQIAAPRERTFAQPPPPDLLLVCRRRNI